MILVNGRIIESRDVKFLNEKAKCIKNQKYAPESQSPNQSNSEKLPKTKHVRFSLDFDSPDSESETESKVNTPTSVNSSLDSPNSVNSTPNTPTSVNSTPDTTNSVSPSTRTPNSDSTNLDSDFCTPGPSTPKSSTPKASNQKQSQPFHSRLRAKESLKLPRKLMDHVLFMSSIVDICEPQSYNEALKSENSNQWIDAMNEELKAHEENNTWSIVKKPENKKIIDLKWL